MKYLTIAAVYKIYEIFVLELIKKYRNILGLLAEFLIIYLFIYKPEVVLVTSGQICITKNPLTF